MFNWLIFRGVTAALAIHSKVESATYSGKVAAIIAEFALTDKVL